MARTATLLEMRTRARESADMVNSLFVSDDELTRYINEGISELHDLLIMQFGEDYYLKSASLTITSGDDTSDIPSDFYKIAGIDVPYSGTSYSLKKFDFAERNAQILSSDVRNLRYRLVGTTIKFSPVPSSTITATIWYHPYATVLSSNGSTFDGINGWEEYVVIDAAIKMLNKEESNTNHLLLRKQEIKDRINRVAKARDTMNPERVRDTESYVDSYLYPIYEP